MTPFTETLTSRPVRLELEDVVLNGDLAVPSSARGLVLFAHGSGSSRHSTGAAAALLAAARRPNVIRAVVSRGGRPDLAEDSFDHVRAATLLIVGGNDDVVIELNKQAFALLPEPKKLQIVPGATHLFEEPGSRGAIGEELVP